MVQPLIPGLTDRRRELIHQLVPEDEVDALYARYAESMKAYLAVAPELTPGAVEHPPEAKKLDAILKLALVALAQGRVRGALKKLSWVSFSVFDPDHALDWNDPRNILAAIVHTRLSQTDFYLSEYRELMDNDGKPDWYVKVRGPSGVIRRIRVFPMWGIEHLHHLDNHKKAMAWYRVALMERGIVS